MSDISAKEISLNGLWKNNAIFVQLLGLCPLLGVSNSVVNALGMGLATTLTLTTSNLVVSLIRNQVRSEIRIPVFVLVIAAVVTIIEFFTQAWFYQLYLVLGIFLPLIVTNCVILGRAEAFASKHNPAESALDGFMMGVGFTGVIVALGAIREVLGKGTLFADFNLMFGSIADNWTITIIGDYQGFLLAILPPGAFIALGFLIALKNFTETRIKARENLATSSQPTVTVNES